MYTVEKAKSNELNIIKNIYNKASEFLKTNNVDQWQNGYPSIDVIKNDFENGNLYVLKQDDYILGVMAFIKEEEPTYKKIYNGNWLSNNIYYTIHRISVLKKGQGLSKYFFEYAIDKCIEDGVFSLRIDTHKDNLVMQKALNKMGFEYCGIIYLKDGDKRMAFERLIEYQMKEYVNEIFSSERALYNKKKIKLFNCKIQGEEDGESALKECEDVIVEKTLFDLRYPIWHTNNIDLNNIKMTVNCRAPMWYSNNININDSNLNCVKGLRECNNINMINVCVDSQEYAWKCNNINIENSTLKGEYMFMNSSNIKMDNVNFSGKYSFQYVNNLEINNCKLNTKDAFWHANNVTVKDSYIKGEYLAWYSKNLKLINCVIEGTQPLCYCEGLVLENCTMINCDLSFEYSEVNAKINGNVDSIKNPLKGYIECGSKTQIILENSKYDFKGEIVLKDN